VFWVLIIAWCLYLVVVYHDYEISDRESRYIIYSIIIPIAPAVIPLALGNYEEKDEYCWINPESGDLRVRVALLRIFCFYFFVWIVLFLIILIYNSVRKQLLVENLI